MINTVKETGKSPDSDWCKFKFTSKSKDQRINDISSSLRLVERRTSMSQLRKRFFLYSSHAVNRFDEADPFCGMQFTQNAYSNINLI